MSTTKKTVDSDKDPHVGSLLANRYLVQSVLGKGGMGVVYRANDEQTDRTVAIKMLHSHKVADSEALKRFNREARTVAQVNHHNIVKLFDFGMSKQGQPFLVMDFIEGHSLKDELEAKGALPFDRASRIFEQVFDALDLAHSQDVVHRDLKPENIILSTADDNDDVKIVDFGLSKLKETDPFGEDVYQITKAGDVCGSPPYMSPEQCLSNSVVDPRSDIYSMAICVYETLSGNLPYKAKSAIEMMDCHLYGTPIPFSESAQELEACNETTYVLNKALAKEPDNRYLTCGAMWKELKDAMRRDWPKVRSYRYRMSDVAYKDLESEAIALATGEHPVFVASNKAEPTGVQQVIAEFNTETAIHKENRSREVEHSGAEMADEKQSIIDKLLSLFRRAEHDEESDYQLDEVDLGYDNCPFCAAPVTGKIRFCVNCQRQLPTVQEFTKLRHQGGRFNLQGTGLRTNTRESKGFSTRAKMRSSSPGMSMSQKLLTLILICLVGYVGYVNIAKDKEMVKKIQRMVAALK
ncbi:MAG TPA: serine/threonine-protein kinase [Candidatus Melainabacteria bacterium]|nr:serine/threonine-protein kinase [Candidatus Melainabacteria bacterium]